MTEELEKIMPNEQNESDVQQEELRIPAESDLPLDEPNHLEEVDFEGTEFGVVEDAEGEAVKQPEAPASENLAPNEICAGEPCELQEGGKRKKRKKRRKIDEYTLENDIRYRGPLSYSAYARMGVFDCCTNRRVAFNRGEAGLKPRWQTWDAS